MSIESRRLSVWDNTHLCVETHGEESSNWTLTPLSSIIQGLSFLLEREGRLCRKGKRRRPALLQTLERSQKNSQELRELQHNQYQTVSLSDDAQLKVVKLNNDSGAYLVVYESWNSVKYLQVSNAAGYVVALDGVLFLPVIEQDHASERHYLSCCAYSSLWTNGTDISNNDGDIFMKRIEDLITDINCIKLESECGDAGEVAQSSSWRAVIGSSLQQVTVNEHQYQQQQLRARRCKYLYSDSLAVLNQVVADEECVHEANIFE
jgi:hypothetical protein